MKQGLEACPHPWPVDVLRAGALHRLETSMGQTLATNP
jgi:hypothetical protein